MSSLLFTICAITFCYLCNCIIIRQRKLSTETICCDIISAVSPKKNSFPFSAWMFQNRPPFLPFFFVITHCNCTLSFNSLSYRSLRIIRCGFSDEYIVISIGTVDGAVTALLVTQISCSFVLVPYIHAGEASTAEAGSCGGGSSAVFRKMGRIFGENSDTY